MKAPRPYELCDEQLELLLVQMGQADRRVCGLDEAGRGALAGPVVAAAVTFLGDPPPGLADSKKVTPKRRELLFDAIHKVALVGVGVVEADEIDRINILQANFKAMQLALQQLGSQAEQEAIGTVLVDGDYLTMGLQHDSAQLGATIHAVVKGDAKVQAISAASIIAKVTRDRIMTALDSAFPSYGFAEHAGYGSASHLANIQSLGPCAVHRMTFAPMSRKSRVQVPVC